MQLAPQSTCAVHGQQASSSSARPSRLATCPMTQLHQLPNGLVEFTLECFSLRPMLRDNGIACCNRKLRSLWRRTRNMLLLQRTAQVRNALQAHRSVLNSLSQTLVADVIHHWIMHADAGLPLMMGPTLTYGWMSDYGWTSSITGVIINHWRNHVRLWMDPQEQQQYSYRLEQGDRQSAHQFAKTCFRAYLWCLLNRTGEPQQSQGSAVQPASRDGADESSY